MRSTANHNCIAQLSLAGLAWVAALALLPISVSASQQAETQPLEVPGTGITVYTQGALSWAIGEGQRVGYSIVTITPDSIQKTLIPLD